MSSESLKVFSTPIYGLKDMQMNKMSSWPEKKLFHLGSNKRGIENATN